MDMRIDCMHSVCSAYFLYVSSLALKHYAKRMASQQC